MAFVQIIVLIVLAFGVGTLILFVVKSVAAPKRIEGIQKLIKQGKNVQAIKLAKSLLAKSPNDYMAHYFLGKAYLADNRTELALMEYKTVNQTAVFGEGLSELDFRKEISALYSKYNLLNEALKEYLLLTKLEPKNPENFYNAGFIYDNQGHPEVALGFYQKAISLNKRHQKAHAALGLILYNMKQLAEAKREIDLAIQINPDMASNYYYLGKILKGNKDYGAAVKAFEKSFRDPVFRQKSLIERGTCFMLADSLDNAAADFERAVNAGKNGNSRDTLYARYFLASCFEKQRKIEKAIEQWKAIFEKDKNFRDVGAKLNEYQDIQTNDSIKEYLTCNDADFFEICKKIAVSALNVSPQQVSAIKDGCQIIATDKSSEDWRNVRKQLFMLWFNRSSATLEDNIIREALDKAKELSCSKAVIISSSGYSRPAKNFAENRPIELIDRAKLDSLMTKVSI
ncbi:tetratricopeptide repeat protein [Treponema parvum]|uniref:Tetratricopeptide repeat protein n=1 Tax=Treponema parvum TaxID=138851 RepID=A0A975F3J8_9SPIR|nr:tetratricopeptide repeat protein [Treponema parvum]QTQ13837.1 tetratricopeptide repeat protein [Treponema parvum]